MLKRISYYTLIDRGASWSESIQNQFSKNISKYGIAYFENDSKKESKFRKALLGEPIQPLRKTILKPTGKDIYNFSFHYLSVKSDKNIYDEDQFMDFSNACKGTNEILCRINVRQKNKLIIDLKRSKSLDIMKVPFFTNPNIFIISKRLKELIESSNLSGYELVPCLNSEKSYTEDDMRLDFNSEKLIDEAFHFQLVVKHKVRMPAIIGKILRITDQCHACKTLYGYYFDKTPYFNQGDLIETDFQRSWGIRTIEGKIHDVLGENLIISLRAFRLFIENKVKGLSVFLTDPPIKHGVVEIKETTNEE